MNNIYKVIWSKAKNCYVVASEIARSHTKSASGSEKIGGVTRRSLLASLMALSLLCGGLGVASAANGTVHVAESSASSDPAVYTTEKVNILLDGKADKTALDSKANETEVVKNTENIATNKENITKLENNKADKTYVDNAVAGAVATAGTNVNAKLAAYATTEDVDTKLAGKANKTDLEDATNRITTNETNITALQKKTTGLSEDGKSLNSMNNVETGALKVTGQISNGTVTTTLAEIDASMEQTKTNAKAIDTLQTTTAGQADAIKDLKDKTTNISYDSGKQSTSINGIEIGSNQVDMNGKNLTGVGTINGIDLGTVDTQVKTNADAIAQEKTDRENAIGSLTENKNYIEKAKNVSDNLVELDKQAKTNADNIQTNANNIKKNKDEIARVNGELVKTNNHFNTELSKTNDYFNAELGKTNNHFNTELGKTNAALQEEGKVRANADAALANDITATNKRTAGIGRTDTGVEADNQTVIEGKVHFDQNGNVSGVKNLQTDTIHATGGITSEGLDAGSGEIQTKGKVSAGDVSTGTLETTGNATIGGNLDVNGKLNVGEIYMEHHKQESTGEKYDSATSITADGISNNAKVTDRNGVTTESTFTHDKKGSTTYAYQGDAANWKKSTSNVTADGVENVAEDSKGNNNTFTQTSTDTKNTLTDKEGNTSSTRQDSKGIYGYAKDKDGNKSYTKQEGNRIAESVIGQDGKQTKSEMTSTDITNTAKDGTITSDAKDIVNKATGNISNSSATMDTTVTGKATESYGELETEVKGNEKHTVKGNQTNEVDGKQINTIKNGQENIISGGQTNTITGGQVNNITGDQTTTITGNKKETVTENVTEDYQKNLTTTVGGNEIHDVKGTKTETVEGKLTENFRGGQATNVTGDQDITVSGTQTTTATDINRNASSGMIDTIDNDYGTNTETKVAGKTTTDVSIKGTGEEGKYIRGANESRDYLIKGTLKNSETKTVEKTSTEITDGNGKTSATIQDVNNLAGSVTNGTETGVSGIHANDNSVSIDSIVTDGNKYSVINQKKGSIQSTVVDGTNSTVILQDKDNVTIASSNGIVAIGGKDIVNNAQDTITNTAGTKITDTAGDSTVTTEKAKGTTFTKTGSTAYSTAAGAPTDTNIAGNHITTGRVDANELGVSDKDDQGNTADLSVKAGEGIKGSATDKDGNKTYTKVTATENSFQVQDKDGNIKNHQVNTKDSSENTITNGDKTNTVTSTADGTTFNNSKANTAFEGGTYKNTTIKGNTITTGKVTMDYADVMRDLGVRGNATVDKDMTVKGNTTLGEAGKDTTLTVNSKATFNENATFEKGAEVKNGLTVSSGGLNVTGESTFNDKVTMKNGLDVTGGVASDSFTVKGTDIKIDSSGINAGGTVISNVADGSISEGSKDAVNGGQLYQVKNDLEGKVNKVGANAAAMANLHPMEFDPDSKWNIAAAMGNYGSETATAIGAFYRPNEDVMVNLSTAFGTGENMVGGGVSVRLGKGSNKLSRQESNALKAQVNDLTARMDALLSVLNPNMSKDFPDVPENHWAYEAVSRLAGNDIVQGYPDGEFHGDRTMTRYEMAEIIYNALSRGAEAERELVEEFKPELQAMAASEKATAERAEG